MLRSILVLALAASASAFKVPTKPAPPAPLMKLRGGADLGPLTPSLLTKIQVRARKTGAFHPGSRASC